MPDSRRGLILGALAYVLWGSLPLYWALLEDAGAVEVLAHRIAWSLVTMAVVLLAWRRWPQLVALVRTPRTLAILSAAAVVVTMNWGIYIWAVDIGRVVEVSLGYFINPLVTVLLGVLVLGERLRRLQWAAMGLALVAVAGLAIDYGRPPWIALSLALTFAAYGLAKKTAGAGAVESLTLETMVMTPVALAYLAFLASTGASSFASYGTGHAVLLVATGIVTAVPLVLFGAAAVRVSLVSLGLMQYIAPTIQFALGILVFHEEMPASRWLGFSLVWAALLLFTVEAANHRRRQLRLVARASAA